MLLFFSTNIYKYFCTFQALLARKRIDSDTFVNDMKNVLWCVKLIMYFVCMLIIN